ncbi:hypothetical protein REL07_013390 [Clostridioides difficile]|nr:hypothetical protein [Clostridioides difficile]MCR1381316.1 hypothetical protein [Clostridioides difficile]MCR1410735.1 hypothetical protein [Clostridioides difficile]MCR1420789.1 hypothetical protein [Clostridioides difficile]MCR1513269.1 hypothetical protein [Clostridioides difficile]MCW0767217.1 hypothetical protein [Clostridioides difficile]
MKSNKTLLQSLCKKIILEFSKKKGKSLEGSMVIYILLKHINL